jgi:hypothetical protein
MSRHSFVNRPADPERWVRTADQRQAETSIFTARLTIDVTPELRRRIKVVAFGRGITVAAMLRALLAREYPPTNGATS